MARQVRLEYAGAFYHVMARGDRREPIVEEDSDRWDFLETLGRVCTKTGWRVHGWVLMSNHYHWLLETPEANLVAGMKWFQNTYTRRFNLRRSRWGHLFGGRYKAVILDPEDSSGYYFETLLDYIHLNPVRAGLVQTREGRGVLDYPWSSLSTTYAVAPSRRAAWMETAEGFAVAGFRDTVAGRRKYVESLEARLEAEQIEKGWKLPEGQTLQSTLQRGWYWGSEGLKEKLLGLGRTTRNRKRGGDYRLSPEGRAHADAEAERLAREGMKEHGLDEANLAALPGSHPAKVEIAASIWRSTTVGQAWIARRLQMGSAANVSQQLYRQRTIESAYEK